MKHANILQSNSCEREDFVWFSLKAQYINILIYFSFTEYIVEKQDLTSHIQLHSCICGFVDPLAGLVKKQVKYVFLNIKNKYKLYHIL